MIKIVNVTLLIVSFLLSISCDSEKTIQFNHRENTLSYKQTALICSDTLGIELDNITNYNNRFVYQNIENNEYLSQINKDKNTCVLYNFNTKHIIKQKFITNGPQGVGQVRFVHYNNWDSVFTVRYHTTKVYLVDSSNNLKSKFDIGNIVSNNEILDISANADFPLRYFKNNLYLRGVAPAKVFTKDYWEYPKGIIYNINSNIAQNCTGYYPQVYKQEICYGIYNYRANRVLTNDGKEVYSFSMDNRLYVYKDSSFLGAYSLKSKHDFEDAPIPSKKLTGYNFNDDWLYEVQRGSYKKLIYDQYRNLIYRIVTLPAEPYDVEGFKTEIKDKPFSVQIIDSAFNLIGEVDFPGKTYDYYNTFASKNGLLISLNNENNPILEENILKLALFKLTKPNETKHD